MKISCDTSRVEAALENMISNVEKAKETEMPNEFLTWQSDDLGREQPRIDAQTEVAVMTTIVDKRTARVKQMRKGRRKIAVRYRPILRPELFERLCERMSDMLARTLSWR